MTLAELIERWLELREARRQFGAGHNRDMIDAEIAQIKLEIDEKRWL